MRYFPGLGGAASSIAIALAYLTTASSVDAQATPQPTPSEPTSPAVSAPATEPPPTTTLIPSAPAPTEQQVPAAAEPTAPPSVIAPPEAAPPPPAAAPAEAPAVDPLSATVGFKPGKGVDIKSADGNFSLNTRLKTQLLYEAHKQASGPNDDYRENFVIRRMRLAFQGNVFSKNVKYKLEFTFAAQELNRVQPSTVGGMAARLDRDVVTQVPLMDAYFDITPTRDFNIRVGQSKIPFGRERVLSDNEMIVIDRSLEDTEFNLDRDMGIDIRSQDFLGLNLLHYYIGVWMAEERNTTFTSLGNGDTGLLYLARLELVPFGNFEEVPGDFEHGAPKLSIGVAYSFLQTDANSPYARQSLGRTLGALNDLGKVDYNVSNFTADLLFKGGGLSIMSAFHYRKASKLPLTANGIARNGIGWVGQAGFLLSKTVPIEPAIGFGLIRAIDKDKSNIVETNELTFGLNYYPFNVHALKLQAEYAHIWWQKAMTTPPDDNRIRVQFQVLL